MPRQDAVRQSGDVGRLLLVSAETFIREKLHVVHASGFEHLTEATLALVQNLHTHGTRLTEIALRAGMTKQSMLELVDKAERLGFVERRPDPDDQRAKMVTFTPSGLRMLGRLRQGIAAAERHLAAVVGAAFMAELKERLAAYASASAGCQGVADGESLWRTRNAGRLLAAAARVFVRDVLREVHQGGFDAVTEVHLRLFRHLDANGTRLTEIAARAKTTKQSMAELLDKTEALGLVTRQQDAGDGRVKVITLTQPGLRVLAHITRGAHLAEQRFADAVGHAFLDEMLVSLELYWASVSRPLPGLVA